VVVVDVADYRVLITGSRRWPTPRTVHVFLDHQLHHAVEHGYDRLVVVHGAASGADTHARNWVRNFGASRRIIPVVEEPYKPDYNLYSGKVAPLKRNQVMVDAGADICGAFRYGGSPGTADCMRKAQDAGIPVAIFEYMEGEQ
jgi:hypothetical protein